MKTSLIHMEHVYRWFGEGRTQVRALTDITLTLGAGTHAVLVGPSGSGKTTLLNLLGALERPSRGQVTIGGDNVSAFSERQACEFRRHQVGFVFQDNALLPELTVAENIEMPLVLIGVGSARRRQRVAEMLHLLGLEKRGRALPAELSGGEKQRVAVARAVIHQPQIVLADEPTANLDAVAALAVLQTLRQLAAQQQLTMLIATHDPRVYQQFDQVIRLDDGMLCTEASVSPPQQ